MQKTLCRTIFLNQKVRNKQRQCAETTSSFRRGGANRALKDANVSTESATKPSSGFALKDIKSSIFQIPLNPYVLIKNVVPPVNFCRELHLVLFSTWKWKRKKGHDLLRAGELHTWDVPTWDVTCATTTFQGGRSPTSLMLEEGSGMLGRAHRGHCRGDRKLCRTGGVPDEFWLNHHSSSKLSSPPPYASHTTSAKCLSTGTYHRLL